MLQLNVKDGKVETVRVDMGEPILEPDKIPVISTENPVTNLKAIAEGKDFTFTCVSMGNPHAITIVEDVQNFDVNKYGKVLEIDKQFPKRINVEFAQIVDEENIKMRVWERGAGETLACRNRGMRYSSCMSFKWLYKTKCYNRIIRRKFIYRMGQRG